VLRAPAINSPHKRTLRGERSEAQARETRRDAIVADTAQSQIATSEPFRRSPRAFPTRKSNERTKIVAPLAVGLKRERWST
jgi:hypothetical protein